MMTVFWIAVAVFVGLQAYVRLAPTDPQGWTIDDTSDPAGAYGSARGYKVVVPTGGDTDGFLAAFDREMMAQPRTRKLATVQGQKIYITRSLLWGFPDYTTVAVSTDQSRATIFSRLRFGQSDMGVNKKRLQQVLEGLGIAPEG